MLSFCAARYRVANLPLLTSLLLAGSLSPASAAELLNPVVVTGTLTEKTVNDSPVRTEVVSRQEIERTHAQTLKDALENIPGLQLSQIHGKAGYQVSLQGLSSDQVLVLIDGLPITDSTGSTTDVSQYALATVDHIEVVKGAASAQYGSSAMGGVINVITRPIEPGAALTLESQAGSYGNQNTAQTAWASGLRHHRASLSGGSQTLRARLSAERLDDQGFSTQPDEWAQQGGASQRKQYALRLDWLPTTQGHIWLEGNRYQENDDNRYDLTLPPQQVVPQQHLEAIKRNRVTGGGSWRWNNGVRASLKGVNETYRGNGTEFSNFTVTDARHAWQRMEHVSGQLDLPWWNNQVWSLGADVHRDTLRQDMGGTNELSVDQAQRDSRELYLQNDIFLGDNLELLIGGRWQRDSDFGDHAAPKASLRYSLPSARTSQTHLRLSYGEGYRVPNLKERHFLFDHSALGYKVIGNPDLLPEQSQSWQLGVSHQWQTRLSIDTNVFYNAIRDLIQTDQANAQVINGISHYSYRNVGRATTRGIETSVKWWPTDALELTSAYTWTDAQDTGNDIDLTNRPTHIARLGANWTLPSRTTLTLRHRYQSSELIDSSNGARSPAWHRIDFMLNQDIARGLGVFFGINNLLDKQRDFADPQDFSPITGRFVYAGLRYQWQKPAIP